MIQGIELLLSADECKVRRDCAALSPVFPVFLQNTIDWGCVQPTCSIFVGAICIQQGAKTMDVV